MRAALAAERLPRDRDNKPAGPLSCSQLRMEIGILLPLCLRERLNEDLWRKVPLLSMDKKELPVHLGARQR